MLALDMYTSLSSSYRGQKAATEIPWGQNDFKCFSDLNDDVLYLIAMVGHRHLW